MTMGARLSVRTSGGWRMLVGCCCQPAVYSAHNTATRSVLYIRERSVETARANRLELALAFVLGPVLRVAVMAMVAKKEEDESSACGCVLYAGMCVELAGDD